MKAVTASKSELANQYGISVRTLAKWLENIPELVIDKNVRLLTPKQVKLIYEKLGEP
jgi:DNA-binding transcriptional regulator YiaG